MKLGIAIAMLLCVYSSTAAQASNPQASTHDLTFSGRLIAPDGAGVGDATIRLSGRTATTDRDGRFRMSAPAGAYRVEVAAVNYQPLTLQVTLNADVDLVIDLQAALSRANAVNRQTGADIPEAPRLIWDLLGTADRMPLKLHAKFEFEYVGRKPLGNGFTAAPVREFRGSISRPFAEGRLDGAAYFFIASGFTGQTLETLQLPGELTASERIVGVRIKSYASVGLTYHFRHIH